ncbi:MAG: peptidoglycan-binding protein [Actinobacteria bacterium]|nr:peptidoglycan-binding protein [Actinomycetota bacterium]MBW3649915.1 peptidoglycan-binding protein [Actinomycetota bacterium]
MALGFDVGGDPPGTYGGGTVAAVRAFQERRGIRTDGVCGDQTWSALVEAGYRLGDRPLYLAHPMQRGDDVAELQRRLGSLGFDGGRVDGILGPRTERALADFQRNAGLVSDAVCGPATIAALERLGSSCDAPHSVATVREREEHRRGSRSLSGRRIAVGETGGLDALARSIAGVLTSAGGTAVVLQHPDSYEQAGGANAAGAAAYLGVALATDGAGRCSTAYYRSPSGWESPEGRRLAELVQAALTPVLGGTSTVRGMAVPVLRETVMPAVVVELAPAALVVERSAELAQALTAAVRLWVEGAPEE